MTRCIAKLLSEIFRIEKTHLSNLMSILTTQKGGCIELLRVSHPYPQGGQNP